MAHVLKPRVAETTTSTGTGPVTLAGALTAHQPLSAVMSVADTTEYMIVAVDSGGTPTGDWEEGFGTYSGANTLTRTTVTNSTNGGAAVSFAAGTKVVLMTPLASRVGGIPRTTTMYKGDGSGALTAAVVNTDYLAPGASTGVTSIVTPSYVTFNATPTGVPTTTPGTLYWDSADGAQTFSLVMAGGSVVQQIGEEQYYRIKASSAITNGQVVMATGSVGGSGVIKAAPASGAIDGSYVMGVATEDIANNAFGYVTAFGVVRGIDTTGGAEAWTDGTVLYYNPAVAGGLTKTLPTAPNPKVIVAMVVNAASNGSLFVRVSSGSTLGNTDSNVQIGTLADKDFLVYSSANARWQNTTQQASMNAIAGGVTSGQYLRGNGTNVVLSAIQAGDVPTLNQNTSGSAGSVANAVTFNNGGSGDASGTTFNGSAAKTISYNTVGAPSTSGANASGSWGISVTGSSASCTGNAATVTNGVYTSGSYSDPTWITAIAGSKVSGNISGNAANVTGTVAVANGGTGATTASAAFNALSPVTTKGDLVVGSGTNASTRLGVGTDAYVLTADSASTNGIKWAAVSGGVGSTLFTWSACV